MEAELSAFSHAIDRVYNLATVPLTVAIVSLYVAPLGDWRAYAIVPMTCFLIPMLCTKFVHFCHQKGFLRYIYNTMHAFLSGAFVKLWLNVKVLRESKPGQIFLCFSVLNMAGFTGYWATPMWIY